MKIRVLTSCTSKKTVSCPEPLTQADFVRGSVHVKKRQEALRPYACPARDLYAGEQHLHLMRGVQEMRRAGLGCDIDVAILSAGYGLVTEEQIIVPYDITFSSMGKQEIQAWADFLDIPASVQQWFEAKGDLNLVLLGDAYLKAASMDASWQIATPTILFCGSVAASKLPDWHNVRKVTLTREDARRLHQGLVWIKGYLASRLLERVCREPGFLHRLFDLHLDLIGELSGFSEAGKQLSLLYPPAK